MKMETRSRVKPPTPSAVEFTLLSSATAAFPVAEGFESTQDALVGWSFVTYGRGVISIVSSNSPYEGGRHLFFNTPFRDNASQWATLAIDLSSQVDQTNLFLEFAAKRTSSSGVLYVEASNDTQIWKQLIPPGMPSTFITDRYSVDIQAVAFKTNNISMRKTVFIRFRNTVDPRISDLSDGQLYLDAVRVRNGEIPAGPMVVGVTPSQWAGTNTIFNSTTVTFDRAIDTATFTGADVVLRNPWGEDITPVNVAAVGGSGNTQFNLTFANQTLRGTYLLIVGPQITDTNGNLMNQNGNSVFGEFPSGWSSTEPFDFYIGTVDFLPAARPASTGPVVFEETFENWPPVSQNWAFSAFPTGRVLFDNYLSHSG